MSNHYLIFDFLTGQLPGTHGSYPTTLLSDSRAFRSVTLLVYRDTIYNYEIDRSPAIPVSLASLSLSTERGGWINIGYYIQF